ncbi:MAG: carboxypeptidase-like regulatory domain-containing protein [Candidatus Paceibacterota bacterium]
MTSPDTDYDGFALSDVTVSIDDNDGSTTSSSSGSSGSGGGNNSNPPVVVTPPPTPVTPVEPIDPPPPSPVTPEPEIEDPITPVEPTEPTPPPVTPVNPPPLNTPDTQEPNIEKLELAISPSENLEPKNLKELSLDTFENTLDFVKEIPKEIKDTVAVAGITLPAIVFAISQPAVATNVISIPLRLWNLVPIWLGFRRRKRPWGTVYDSVTKQPLDPVYVILTDMRGKEVATTITDLDGRFGFLVAPGRYHIFVKKDNYTFPSTKLSGKESDALYGDLYQGEEIEIVGEEDLVVKNIPMDSLSFNWNEFEKSKNAGLMKFYSKRDLFLAKIANIVLLSDLLCLLSFHLLDHLF